MANHPLVGSVSLVLIIQATNIILHIRGVAAKHKQVVGGSMDRVGDNLFGNRGLYLAGVLLGLQTIGLIVEAISTHLELRIRSQYIFELLVPYQPKDAYTKELYIKRCLTFYRESVRQMLHAVSKFFLPFLVLLLALTFLRKEHTATTALSSSSQFTGFMTPVIQNPLQLLREYTSQSPAQQTSKLIAVIPGFGICRGFDALNTGSENPFKLSSELSLGSLLNETFMELALFILLLVQTSKFLFTAAYLTMVVTTSEDID